jgi:hypothetical protein
LLEGVPFALFGDGTTIPRVHVHRPTSSTRLSPQWSAGAERTTSAAGRRPRCWRRSQLLEQISGRKLEIEDRPPVPGDQRRTKADTTASARSWAGWPGHLPGGRFGGSVAVVCR